MPSHRAERRAISREPLRSRAAAEKGDAKVTRATLKPPSCRHFLLRTPRTVTPEVAGSSPVAPVRRRSSANAGLFSFLRRVSGRIFFLLRVHHMSKRLAAGIERVQQLAL